MAISIKPSRAFHLNHVGYKAEANKNERYIVDYFHLNHVGYKVVEFVQEYHRRLSFIWTMWDIKRNLKDKLHYLWGNFHLNHVGYKGFFDVTIRMSYKTFIWTMWDIKLVWHFWAWLRQSPFIWTMWDIKRCFSRDYRIAGTLSSEPCGI